MKKSKKIFWLVIAILVIVYLSGCDSDNGKKDGTKETIFVPVEIKEITVKPIETETILKENILNETILYEDVSTYWD